MSGSGEDEFLGSFKQEQAKSMGQLKQDTYDVKREKFNLLFPEFAIALVKKIYFTEKHTTINDDVFRELEYIGAFLDYIIAEQEGIKSKKKDLDGNEYEIENITPSILAGANVYLLRLIYMKDLDALKKIRTFIGQDDAQHVRGFSILLTGVIVLLAIKNLTDFHISNESVAILLENFNTTQLGLPPNTSMLTQVNMLEGMILDAFKFSMSFKVKLKSGYVEDPELMLEKMIASNLKTIPNKRDTETFVDALLSHIFQYDLKAIPGSRKRTMSEPDLDKPSTPNRRRHGKSF